MVASKIWLKLEHNHLFFCAEFLEVRLCVFAYLILLHHNVEFIIWTQVWTVQLCSAFW